MDQHLEIYQRVNGQEASKFNRTDKLVKIKLSELIEEESLIN